MAQHFYNFKDITSHKNLMYPSTGAFLVYLGIQ